MTDWHLDFWFDQNLGMSNCIRVRWLIRFWLSINVGCISSNFGIILFVNKKWNSLALFIKRLQFRIRNNDLKCILMHILRIIFQKNGVCKKKLFYVWTNLIKPPWKGIKFQMQRIFFIHCYIAKLIIKFAIPRSSNMWARKVITFVYSWSLSL